MNKEEYIKRYGEVAYENMRQQDKDWKAAHPEEANARTRAWCAANPDKVKARHQESSHKGGKYYEKQLEYNRTGLQGERSKIRQKHGRQYRHYKKVIAIESQIHHEWIPGTGEYTGVALLEKDRHMHGYVDVIKILDGKITLLTEKEIRGM